LGWGQGSGLGLRAGAGAGVWGRVRVRRRAQHRRGQRQGTRHEQPHLGYIQMQPAIHTVAAWDTYGCSWET
jgi:hypothetical protein